jgi:hypothetical protein
MSPNTPCSFFDRLTSFKHSDHEATDLIRFLVRVLAHDAGSARRNSLTVYKLIDTVRKISDELGNLIDKVDNETNVNSWDDYDSFTSSIHPLEKYGSLLFLWLVIFFLLSATGFSSTLLVKLRSRHSLNFCLRVLKSPT